MRDTLEPVRHPRGITLLQVLITTGRVIHEIRVLFGQRLVPLMAAGLAFHLLLGLIPFLFITTAAAGFFFQNQPITESNLYDTLLGLLPPGAGEAVLGNITSLVQSWEGFGVLGLVSLFFVAAGLFESLEWSINGAMGSRRKVGFLHRRLLTLAYVMGAMLFFSVAAVGDYAFQLLLAAPGLQELTSLIHVPRRAFSTGSFTVFLLILYLSIPARRPQLLRAVIVAVLVAAGWALLQKLGATVTIYISRRHAVYGALAGGALFLTWMYLLALFILLGALMLDVWSRAVRRLPLDADAGWSEGIG
ncbi:MAG: YihY/virulence factor BrkB family protein [Candidatus Krumholzibacteria bacterium]|nr:YihY/virulence factor BrkB family protein [Candidatus Krumholzibacteria bacterium]MDH5268669.1 YihY/virulence factor BrkB family protein [Candidatus Krumholzibacteria bacterium]